ILERVVPTLRFFALLPGYSPNSQTLRLLRRWDKILGMAHRGLSQAMHFLMDKVTKLRVGWNERPLTEEDFYSLCRHFGVTWIEAPLRKEGMYFCANRGHFISFDVGLPERER